jgi:hypothetical protein
MMTLSEALKKDKTCLEWMEANKMSITEKIIPIPPKEVSDLLQWRQGRIDGKIDGFDAQGNLRYWIIYSEGHTHPWHLYKDSIADNFVCHYDSKQDAQNGACWNFFAANFYGAA